MPRPRNPKGVPARRKDEKSYERVLRRMLLEVLFSRLRSRLALVTSVNQAYAVMNGVVGPMIANPTEWLDIMEIQRHLNNLEGYQRQRLLATFRSALGVNISPFLSQPEVAAFMTRKIAENVDLIKTLPPRTLDSLRNRLERELAEAPFDQQRLQTLLRDEYKSSGYNLRRLTRDQTSKTIGQLNQIRQAQLGVISFIWRDSDDERVRPEHVERNGNEYLWSNPPDGEIPGGPIQCRCYAEPVITPQNRARLGATK